MATRRRKKDRPEEIVATFRDPDAMLSAGKDMSTVLQTLEASGATLARRQSQYGGMKHAKVKRHKQPENENRRPRSPLVGSVLRQPEAEASFGRKLACASRKLAAALEPQRQFLASERRARTVSLLYRDQARRHSRIVAPTAQCFLQPRRFGHIPATPQNSP